MHLVLLQVFVIFNSSFSIRIYNPLMSLIVDAHQDLAWNALSLGRDYSRSAQQTREAEQGGPNPGRNGNSLLGLPDYLRGNVAVVFSTLYAAPLRRRFGEWETQCYKDTAQAHLVYAKQLDYYERLADEHQQFKLINTVKDLEGVLATWKEPAPAEQRRVGLVRLMEGADGVREPKEIEWWYERGVRVVGLAWAGTRYAGGTGEPGPLTDEGRELLNEMANFGLILDLSHSSDESYLQSIERYQGVVIASHANPRALLKNPQRPERFLSDDMIRVLAQRGGVAGIVPYNHFLNTEWRIEDGKDALTLDTTVIAMIDYICQLTGSADHVALGSDFDGGFGLERTPAEIDTVADLGLAGTHLQARGYTEADVEKILNGNWLRILRQGLPA
jgi:membrane dipeptidase